MYTWYIKVVLNTGAEVPGYIQNDCKNSNDAMYNFLGSGYGNDVTYVKCFEAYGNGVIFIKSQDISYVQISTKPI